MVIKCPNQFCAKTIVIALKANEFGMFGNCRFCGLAMNSLEGITTPEGEKVINIKTLPKVKLQKPEVITTQDLPPHTQDVENVPNIKEELLKEPKKGVRRFFEKLFNI